MIRSRPFALNMLRAAFAATAFSTSAMAADKINLKLGGFFNAAAVGVSQNENQ